jgi:3D-(3,5/4)-trihydroxycyclohexane-1,2-dione acylhydrolase (decyclizing)
VPILTTSQAIVRWAIAQKIRIDGDVHPYFAGTFAIFGHGNALSLGDALHASQKEMITFRGQTEEGMGLAAVGYAKAMRRQQCAIVTTSVGPGAMNVVTAAGTALANRLPMMILVGDTFHSRIPDPVLQQVEHFDSPSTTVNDAFRPVVRFWDRITSPTHILSSLPQALTTLLDPATCGPVCLALPQDVQAESFDFPEEFFAETIHEIPRPRPDLNELKRAAELISQAKKPVIIAGGGVHYSRAEEELAYYAKNFAIPVVETMSGKTSLPWSNPLLVGPLGVTGSDPVNALVSESDLIIAVGTRLQDFTTGSWTLFGNKTIVAINVARFDAIKRHSVAVVGDAKVTLAELSELLKPASATRDQWLSRAANLKKECETLRAQRQSLSSDIPTYAQVVIATNDVARPEDYVLTAAGGLPGELNNNWLAHSVASFDCEYGFSCMGYEISGAWGAAIAQNTMKNKKSSGRVIALTGDGSYMMLNSDIYSAVLHRHPFTLILCDNGGFAVISRLQTGHGADSFRTMITENKNAPRVDFVAHAQAMGAKTFRVNTVSELSKTLVETQNSNDVVVIVMETAPATWTEGGAFWEVGVPEVSSKAEVKAALAKVHEAKKNQRIY